MAKFTLNPKDKKNFCKHIVKGGYDCKMCKGCCASQGMEDHLDVCSRKKKYGHRGLGLPGGGKYREQCCCGEDKYKQFF